MCSDHLAHCLPRWLSLHPRLANKGVWHVSQVVLQSLPHLQRTVVLQSRLHRPQRHANIAHAEARCTKDIHTNVRNCSADMDAMLVIARIAGLAMKVVHTENELA